MKPSVFDLRTRICLVFVCFVGAILMAGQPVVAKTVYCIDANTAPEDPFLSNGEGWARANATIPPDIISLGGDLEDCLAQLSDSDNLVIITHGFDDGNGFHWGGLTYSGVWRG